MITGPWKKQFAGEKHGGERRNHDVGGSSRICYAT
jgi:hypothetical protein